MHTPEQINPSEEALEALKSLTPVFREIYKNALEKMNATLTFIQEPLYNRSKAIIFHNLVMNRAKEYFPTNTIEVKEQHESLRLYINKVFVARFKKLNERGLPANINTPRNKRFIYQQYSLWPQMTQLVCIDIGYNIDLIWSSFNSLQIVCLNGKKLQWSMPIDLEGTGTVPNQFSITKIEKAAEADQAHKKGRVTVKKTKKDDNQKEKGA